MEITPRDLLIYLFTILIAGLPVVIYFGEKRLRKLGGWIPVPPATEIVSLRIYPIKSCRGIELKSNRLLKTGLDLDRQWMFVGPAKKDGKESWKFQTIRNKPKMTLINTAINWEADELEITIANDKSNPTAKLVVPAHPTKEWIAENTTLCKPEIWGEIWDGYMYDEELTKPFSEFLNIKPLRLVLRGSTPRRLRGNGAPQYLGREEATKWADLAPVLVANVRSINELNERLLQQNENAITIERFRPNIIVIGSAAWSEDVWKTIKITPRAPEHITEKGKNEDGSEGVVMDVTCRCARCHVPNTDPDSGKPHLTQPWKTLMSYRNIDPGRTDKPYFGMLCAPRSEGEIKVGDKFEVTEVTGNHRYVSGM